MTEYKEYKISYKPGTLELVESLPDSISESGLGQISFKISKLPKQHVKFLKYKNEEYTVKCSELGHTLLGLEFNYKYYNVDIST